MAQVKDCAECATQAPTGMEGTLYLSGETYRFFAELREFPGSEANGLISKRQCQVPDALKGKGTDPEPHLPVRTIVRDALCFYYGMGGWLGGTW